MAEIIYASSKDADLHYATKTDISDPVLWLSSDAGTYVFLDSRELGAFGGGKKGSLEAMLLDPLAELARKEGVDDRQELVEFLLRRFAPEEMSLTVPRSLPLDIADHLRSKGYILDVREPFFPERSVKVPEEIRSMREVAQRTLAAFRRIEEILRVSVIKDGKIFWQGQVLTSEGLKAEAEIALIREGLADVEGMIISSEAHSAIPHHRGTGPLLANEPIVCDIFPRDRATGYHADITRTYVKGEPSAEIIAMYAAVKEAGEKAIAAVRPGMPAKELDQLVRNILVKRGYHVGEKGFTHATGHGVGLEVHEAPGVTSRSKEELVPGNVITIEPGLYYPEHGGIRIEDMVLVTDQGGEVLSEYPKTLQI